MKIISKVLYFILHKHICLVHYGSLISNQAFAFKFHEITSYKIILFYYIQYRGIIRILLPKI